MQSRFLEKWERQRQRGPVFYAILHAVFISGFLALIGLIYHALGREGPENLSGQTILFFGVGGFAYGLIRYNIRERFYRSMKGKLDDGS